MFTGPKMGLIIAHPPMERWQSVKHLCRAALDKPAAERAAFLDDACAGDEALRREVESLLAKERDADRFLDVADLSSTAGPSNVSDRLHARRSGKGGTAASPSRHSHSQNPRAGHCWNAGKSGFGSMRSSSTVNPSSSMPIGMIIPLLCTFTAGWS